MYHPESNCALIVPWQSICDITLMRIKWTGMNGFHMPCSYNSTHSNKVYSSRTSFFGYQATLSSALKKKKSPNPMYCYDDYAKKLKERLRATN